MKKYSPLVEDFTYSHKEMIKAGIILQPGDIYLSYCALALCTIADKMTEGSEPLFNPGKEKNDKLS